MPWGPAARVGRMVAHLGGCLPQGADAYHATSTATPGRSIPLPVGGACGREGHEGKCLRGEPVLQQLHDAEPLILLPSFLTAGPKGSKSIRQKLEIFSKEKRGEQPLLPMLWSRSPAEREIFGGAELGGVHTLSSLLALSC